MAAKVQVTVCIDQDLGICTTKLLPLGSTVADLKEHLAADDPTGRTQSQDITLARERGGAGSLGDALPLVASLGKLVLVSAADKRELALPADVVEYRVLQRVAIKKVGTDPATTGVVKLKRKVGSTVFTTGRTWVGPQGGEWVELDAIVEKPGWLLVQGPGFGTPGPLLQRVEPGEAPPLLLHAVKPGQDPDAEEAETREFVLGPQARVVDAKEWISLLFGLDPSSVIVAAPGAEKMHGTIEQCGVLKEGVGMVAAGFQSGDRVHYVYTGDLGSAYEGKEPAWKGGIGSGRPALPAALPAPDDLKKHFALLKLEVDAPHGLIKGQYRRLALENHPDKHPDDPEATRRFQEIKEAYEALREKLHL